MQMKVGRRHGAAAGARFISLSLGLRRLTALASRG
jgi:hypothetical protein